MIQIHLDGAIFAAQTHGGITRQFWNMLHAFGDRDDTFIVLYLPIGAILPGACPHGIKLMSYPRALRLRPVSLFCQWNRRYMQTAVRRMWSKATEGVFHSTYYTSYASLHIPQVCTVHDTIYEQFPHLFSLSKREAHIASKKKCVAAARAIVFPSDNARQEAQSIYDLHQNAIKVIPHAVDSLFRPLHDSRLMESFRHRYTNNREFLLHCGARMAHKNFTGLLEAYTQWDKHDTYVLLTVGGGPFTREEAGLIKSLELEHAVFAVPELSQEELVVAYNAARAIVVPSLSEGFGFPALEALACGKQVALSETGALPEVAGNFGAYFDPFCPRDISRGLAAVTALAWSAERSRRARKFATRRTWSDVASEYITVYQQVLTR